MKAELLQESGVSSIIAGSELFYVVLSTEVSVEQMHRLKNVINFTELVGIPP